MILTKNEFLKEFGYKTEQSFYQLIRDKKIILNSEGMFDTSENEAFCADRRKRLENKKDNKKQVKKGKAQNPQQQLFSEIDALNSKLKNEEKQKRIQLLDLKIAKEQGTVVETSVLNAIIRMTFDDMMKSLTEFPSIYASEIINLVHAEENPKEILVEYLTNKVTESIKLGLANAKKAAQKFYKE